MTIRAGFTSWPHRAARAVSRDIRPIVGGGAGYSISPPTRIGFSEMRYTWDAINGWHFAEESFTQDVDISAEHTYSGGTSQTAFSYGVYVCECVDPDGAMVKIKTNSDPYSIWVWCAEKIDKTLNPTFDNIKNPTDSVDMLDMYPGVTLVRGNDGFGEIDACSLEGYIEGAGGQYDVLMVGIIPVYATIEPPGSYTFSGLREIWVVHK